MVDQQPVFVDLIRKKRQGRSFDRDDFEFLASGVAAGSIPDYQISAWLMAAYLRGLDKTETAILTEVMRNSGDCLDLHLLKKPIVDKHSTGGVGDKISLILAPLVAANGVIVPMISGRGLGHTGGTLDKLEAIPGFRTGISLEDFVAQLAAIGVGIIGQSANFVPLDGILYALRNATATVDNLALITASIMSKKMAEDLDALLLDVKVGSGGFMKTIPEAVALAGSMTEVASAMGKRCVAFVTDMSQPLGRSIGNALEVKEAIEYLQGVRPADLDELIVTFGGALLLLAKIVGTIEEGKERIVATIVDGQGLAIFAKMVEMQGGDPNIVENPGLFPEAMKTTVFSARSSGYISAIETETLGWASVVLGAGRQKVGDPIDPSAGFTVLAKCGDKIEKGQPLLEIAYNEETRLEACLHLLERVYTIGPDRPTLPGSIIIKTVEEISLG